MNRWRYIFLPILGLGNGGFQRSHRFHKQKREGGPKGNDKPPPRKRCIFLYRNAKFTPDFSRGEFGVFQHAYISSAHKGITGTGCRDPPDQSF